ncbi:MAG TPA: ECF transporter S component, partial [Actinomycetota bacterium]|nr:ECF transporter S component [Actinomycetota bacterium]
GVLCGLNAVLRVPGAIGGASLVFVLPIVAGAVFGPAFGFLLGALSFAASGLVTAGIGPWLPFQMFAAGWIGAGAGLLRPAVERVRPVVAVAILCAYGYAAGFFFGVVTNLWFWPSLAAGDASIGWRPGMGAAEAAGAFRRFYLLTSLAWDAGRAVGNVVLIALLGAPALRLLRRWRDRMWTPPTS